MNSRPCASSWKKLTDKDHLNLSRQRVAIIPGNHDVNRKACSSYFDNCEADDDKPMAPWWPKWRHYATMFDEFYRDLPDVTFTAEQPWTLFEVPDLMVVVVGLNSTVVEGHDCQKAGEAPDPKLPRHVGCVGEPQLRWFAERLDKYQDEGWFRIGAVHHNQQRRCKDDEENLEDADDLEHIIGPQLNLLLHGHTHEAKVGWLDQNVPILCTGSAALKKEAPRRNPEPVSDPPDLAAPTASFWPRVFPGEQILRSGCARRRKRRPCGAGDYLCASFGRIPQCP